jgi:hypothetical protein
MTPGPCCRTVTALHLLRFSRFTIRYIEKTKKTELNNTAAGRLKSAEAIDRTMRKIEANSIPA